MNDDLKKLVREDFPRLGYQIMKPISEMLHRDFAGRINHVHPDGNRTDWRDADRKKALELKVIDGDNYHYNCDRSNWWTIAFSNIRLVDIETQDPKPAEVDKREVKIVSLLKRTNNSPSFKEFEIEQVKTETKEEDHSFGVMAATEFETSIERSAKAGIGVAEGESKISARFKASLETSTNHAWRKSDTLSERVSQSYRVFPYSTREVTVEKGTPNIKQVIPTRGILECDIDIDIRNANHQRFTSLSDLKRVFEGLKGGSEFYSDYFARNPYEIDWHQPTLNLDIEVKGKRVRYSEVTDNSSPIPGKEDLYERYRKADLKALEGGSR